MVEKSNMYELEYPAPSMAHDSSEGPNMIIALNGYADAGQSIEQSASHLKAALDHRPLVSFNNDELVDYRSRRPAVTLTDDHIASAEDLTLSIDVVRDNLGTPFLLLSGPEPDLRWEAFTKAVADIADKHDVQNTICLYGAPMTVPHTRPLVVSAHGNNQELVGDMFRLESTLTIPGSASLMIERELHKRGRNVAGFTAHVPHYIAAGPYPAASLRLLQSVQDATGLSFPLRSLEADAERSAQQLGEYLESNDEVAQVVSQLEQQYDEEMERYRAEHPNVAMPGERSLPSGEEIGAEFERFLASVEHEGEDDAAGNPFPALGSASPHESPDATTPDVENNSEETSEPSEESDDDEGRYGGQGESR
ncbi:PAC2 family protein [Corynebacterium tapiri]|uniref:PAC2 family protein n=1 Tax=Corynebacterium tapiri TaxID=1448266 RepID=A0A5C4U4L6_9CORY|nr:PAC2 family protein [Corynebacterium tapiri]TNL99210.1 PAC2 family protein [Corynebacterium tapiri]